MRSHKRGRETDNDEQLSIQLLRLTATTMTASVVLMPAHPVEEQLRGSDLLRRHVMDAHQLAAERIEALNALRLRGGSRRGKLPSSVRPSASASTRRGR